VNTSAVIDVIRSIFRWGEIRSSKLDASKSVVVELSAGDGEASAKDDEIAGFGPLQFKPLAGQDALFMQLGDEKVCLSVRNRNWQISIGDGEVILQALAAAGAPAYIHLKPNGDAVIKGANVTLDVTTSVKIGSPSAAQAMVLGNQLQTILGALTVPTAMGPSGTPLNAANFPNFLSTKHDVDS
jgi:phage gp45-like